jgi:hypothetical protein
MTGWKAKISFEQGVQIMLDHIDYWKEAPLWTPDTITRMPPGSGSSILVENEGFVNNFQ